MKQNIIVLATHNKGKIAELRTLLAASGLDVLGLDAFPDLPEVEETGTTFRENALLKACTVSRLTGMVTVADDSGLEVDHLHGAPGVYSARFSATSTEEATDARNTAKLLTELHGVPREKRSARFRCCMAACAPDGESFTAEGAWEGLINERPAGENGFGYDPVFFDQELGLTAAQMPAEEKNRRSHRGRAVQGLLGGWPAFWQAWLSRP